MLTCRTNWLRAVLPEMVVRFVEDDPEQPDAGLAPVIPLFTGGRGKAAPLPDDGSGDGGRDHGGDSDHDGGLAVARRRHPAGRARVEPVPRSGASASRGAELSSATRDSGAAAAERTLLRKLAARSLSVAEARTVLSGFALSGQEIGDLVAVFVDRGYLDDAALAEQLVHVAVDRKGEGRRAIGATLSRRGVPRAVVEDVLAGLVDDDRERALEFARKRARSLRGLDSDVALRRLVGQLARRGYPGHVAMDAARTALASGE